MLLIIRTVFWLHTLTFLKINKAETTWMSARFYKDPLFFTAFLNIHSCSVWPSCSQLLAIFLASAPIHNFFLSLESDRSLSSSLCRLQVLLRSTPNVQDWLGHSSLCEIGKTKSVMFIISGADANRGMLFYPFVKKCIQYCSEKKKKQPNIWKNTSKIKFNISKDHLNHN